MKVTIMADEISPDLETSLELMRSWNLDTVELRRAGERRYPDVSDYWKSRVPRLVKEFGFSVVAISPGLFKVDYPGPDAPLRFLRVPKNLYRAFWRCAAPDRGIGLGQSHR